jgi:hypothetical protein
LGKEKSIVKSRVLRLSARSDDDIDLKESIQNIYAGRGNIGLAEGAYFENLSLLALRMFTTLEDPPEF